MIARKIYPDDPLAKNANHLQMCSCPLCGNARKWFGYKTLKEEISLISSLVEHLLDTE